MKNLTRFLAVTILIILFLCGCSSSDFLIIGDTLEAYNGTDVNVVIPDEVFEISPDVFQGKDSIISVEVPEKVDKIQSQSFQDCENLVSISLPLRIRIIEDEAFSGCRKLSDIYFKGTESEWQKINFGKNVFASPVTIHFNNNTSKVVKASIANNPFMEAEVKTELTRIGQGYGTRAFIEIDKETAKTASQEEFAEFLEMRVDGKDYNWFTIDFGDGTGIVFSGCIWKTGIYCKLESEGMCGKSIGYLKVVDQEKHLVEYQPKQ